MKQRGRKSADALAILASDTATVIQRPDAPYDLTDEETEVWRAVVETEAADWFRPSQLPLLAQYCRHVVSSRKIAGMIRTLEDEVRKEAEGDKAGAILTALKSIDRLLKMQERESRAMASLATKMRISQQSTYDKSKKKPALGKRPWEA